MWPDLSVLIASLWKITIILLGAGFLSLVLRRASASVRHLIWTSALVAVLAIPLISAALPQWTVPVWTDLLPARQTALFRTNAEVRAPQAPEAPAIASLPAGLVPAQPVAPVNWKQLALILWLAGSAVVLLRIAIGRVAIIRMRRAAAPARPEIALLARELGRAMGLQNGVRVLETASRTIPMTWGVFRPVVLIPAAAAAGDSERLRTILLHELAHIARRDYLLQMLGQVACALYWFHPLVWLAQRKALQFRERASDDRVLCSGVRPSDYASHLVYLARSLAAPRFCGSLGISRCSNLENRIRVILDPCMRRTGLTRAPALVAVLIGGVIAFGLASLRPALAEIPALPVPAAGIHAVLPAFALDGLPVSGAQTPYIGRDYASVESQASAMDRSYEFEKAADLYRQALSLRRETFGESSIEYAKGLEKLGAFYRAWDRLSEARAAYSQALSILERSLGPNHPGLFEPVYFLALEAHSRKDIPTAEALYQRALTLARMSGLTGAEEALAMNGLALIAEDRGELEKADQLLGEAQVKLPGETLERALILTSKSRVLGKLGRDDEAAAATNSATEAHKAWSERAADRPLPQKETRYRIGKGVSVPVLALKIDPDYSHEARLNHLQGKVVLQTEIGADGQIHDLRVIGPFGFGLDQKAVEAVRQWHFKPGIKDGEPVSVLATIEVNFRLL